MVKIGIIGVGHMGGYHASICHSHPEIKLIGIADLNQENMQKIDGTHIKTDNYRELLPHIDAAIIAVPTQHHYQIARDCLENGIHVLLEKPLTKTVEEGKALFSLAAKKNLTLHVGHVERFNGAVQQLKKIVHEPYLIESHRMGPFTPRPQKDSVILDLMIHDLDIILNLVESPVKTINAISSKIKTDFSDIAVVQLLFENGVLANITSSRASQIKKRTMSIHQKRCFIQLDFTTQDISIHSRAADSFKIGNEHMHYTQKGTVQRLFVYNDNPLKLEIEHFVKSIKTKENLIDAQQDLIALELALHIEQILLTNSTTIAVSADIRESAPIAGLVA